MNRVQQHHIKYDRLKQDSLFVGIGNNGKKQIMEERLSRDKVGFLSGTYDQSELQKVLGSTAFTGGVRYSNTYGISALQYV